MVMFFETKYDFSSLDCEAARNYALSIKKRGDMLSFAASLKNYETERGTGLQEKDKNQVFASLMTRWIERSKTKKAWPKQEDLRYKDIEISSTYSPDIGNKFLRDIYSISSLARSDWACDSDLREHIIKASELLNAYDPDNFRKLLFEDCYKQEIIGRSGRVFIKPIADIILLYTVKQEKKSILKGHMNTGRGSRYLLSLNG